MSKALIQLSTSCVQIGDVFPDTEAASIGRALFFFQVQVNRRSTLTACTGNISGL